MSTKYPVRYVSGSKKEALNIEHMPTPHICNALRKLRAAEPDPQNDLVTIAMSQELRARGCVYDSEADHWILPPKGETP